MYTNMEEYDNLQRANKYAHAVEAAKRQQFRNVSYHLLRLEIEYTIDTQTVVVPYDAERRNST